MLKEIATAVALALSVAAAQAGPRQAEGGPRADAPARTHLAHLDTTDMDDDPLDPALKRPMRRAPPSDFDLGRAAPTATRAFVEDPTGESPGAITVDTQNRYLYLSLPGGRAVRYDVGVGRQGFEWAGVARIGRKAEWPAWTPPKSMLRRRPDLPRAMEGGLDNPLGARALYLFDGARDTLFRIHGSNEPWTIGEAVSSGCIRMLNADVVDLYARVRVGAKVVVVN